MQPRADVSIWVPPMVGMGIAKAAHICRQEALKIPQKQSLRGRLYLMMADHLLRLVVNRFMYLMAILD